MGIKIKYNRLHLTQFPIVGILMWMLIGIVFVSIGGFISKADRTFGIIFILCGAGSFLGSFFLKKISVTFDRNTGSVIRCWKAWIGILVNSQSIRIDQIALIVYEREIRETPSTGVSIRKRFSLYAKTKENGEFYFYPVTYTPLNAEEVGKDIAKFLDVDFKSIDTDRGKNLFKRQNGKSWTISYPATK